MYTRSTNHEFTTSTAEGLFQGQRCPGWSWRACTTDGEHEFLPPARFLALAARMSLPCAWMRDACSTAEVTGWSWLGWAPGGLGPAGTPGCEFSSTSGNLGRIPFEATKAWVHQRRIDHQWFFFLKKRENVSHAFCFEERNAYKTFDPYNVLHPFIFYKTFDPYNILYSFFFIYCCLVKKLN